MRHLCIERLRVAQLRANPKVERSSSGMLLRKKNDRRDASSVGMRYLTGLDVRRIGFDAKQESGLTGV
jgi:hypothetical protein